MRILRPTGTPIELDGKQYNLLFTVDVINIIEDHFDNDIVTLLNSMKKDARKGYSIIAYALMTLINGSIEREKLEEEKYDLKKIAPYVTNSTAIELIPLIIDVFNNDSPKNDDEDPNGKSGQQKN